MTRLDIIKPGLSESSPTGAIAIACGILCVAVPTALRAVVDPFVSGTTFGTYYPFVLIASLFLSWRFAAAIALASALIGNFLFVEPRFAILPSAAERFSAVLFIISAMLIIALGNTLRRTVVELHVARESEAHLNRELQHRVKNTLAVVQGLVTQTFRDTPEAKVPLTKLQGRLRALADANDILRDGQWDGCILPDLAVRALAPFNDGGAVSLVGPECLLPQESCVPLVLALHELATNAVKYGALSADGGTVLLSWQPCSHGNDLILTWTEAGGPAVAEPVSRGLGSRLLRPQLGLQSVAISFELQGLVAVMTVADVVIGTGHLNRAAVSPATMHSTALAQVSTGSGALTTSAD